MICILFQTHFQKLRAKKIKINENLDTLTHFISSFHDIYIYKVVISVCLFVCFPDHNSGTTGPICLKFRRVNLGEPRECSYVRLVIEVKWMGKRVKIVIYYKARVISGTNYDPPVQRWVPKLIHNNVGGNIYFLTVGGNTFFKKYLQGDP